LTFAPACAVLSISAQWTESIGRAAVHEQWQTALTSPLQAPIIKF